MSATAHSQKTARRLPAFGRELLQLRLRGLVPARAVVVSLDCWDWGIGSPRLVVPPDMVPEQTDFSMLAAIDIFLAWSSTITPIERRDAVVRAIARCAPSYLWVLDIAAPEDAFFVISRTRGVERPEYLK